MGVAKTVASDNLKIKISPKPIKQLSDGQVATDLLEAQADVVKQELVELDFKAVRGTCVDERARAHLLNGRPTTPRPAVPGGPDIWGLAIAELIGVKLTGSGQERLAYVRQTQNRAGIKSGGHLNCAANAKLLTWLSFIVNNPAIVKAYAKKQLGNNYDDKLAEIVVANAARLSKEPAYQGWSETILQAVYGTEAAEALEVLEEVDHEAMTAFRLKAPNLAVNINEVYNNSVVGVGSYIMNDAYSGWVESIWSSGPAAKTDTRLAAHAREIALCAVICVVPNELIYQGSITL